MNHLYYGDNLQILREHQGRFDRSHLPRPALQLQAGLQPPLQITQGHDSEAQITAFGDTGGIRPSGSSMSCSTNRNTDVAEMMRALRAFLRENDMMASQPLDLSFLRALQ
jgi:hypothetical protein